MPKTLTLLLLFWAAARLSGAPFISEFHAENIGPVLPAAGDVLVGTEDVDHNSADWIEIRNPGAGVADLTGWALSDDPAQPGKWTFPAQSLPAGARLLVFASGKNRRVPGVQLHTNFKLAESGQLLLSKPLAGGWETVHQIGTVAAPYPKQQPRFSYGYPGNLGPDAAEPGYFEIQTPGAENSTSTVSEFVEQPTVTVPRGMFSAPQSVKLAVATPGSKLIYTLDGSEPTLLHGTQVASPSVTLQISAPTCLRFRAIKNGLGSSAVETHTYLFPTAVLTQHDAPLPALPWGLNGPDWEMDPEVTGHPDPASRCVADDLKGIPSVSVVMDWNDLFGTGTAPGGTKAIYPPASGVPPEGAQRRVSVEWINPQGSKTDPNSARGFQQDGLVDIFGGSSPARWNTDKLSLKVNFTPDLRYALYGAGAADRFDNLVLDARYNNVWHYGGGSSNPNDQRLRSDYYGDAFTGDVQRLMGGVGGVGPHAQAVHLYLNGLYWGMYIAHERPDQHYAAAYLGGGEDEWDVIKHRVNAPVPADSLVAGVLLNPAQPASFSNHSAGVNYLALVALVEQDLTNAAKYEAASAKIDLPNFIDYILLNFYFGNNDWSHQNWYATYRRTAPGAQWRWHSWDAEHIMELATDDVTTDGAQSDTMAAKGPGYIHECLRKNALYRLQFADRAHAHLFNGGVLTEPRIGQLFDARLDGISEALRAESARWGDSRASLRPGAKANVPYLRGTEWLAQRAWWANIYFPTRSNPAGSASSGSVVAQLRTQFLYPPATVTAPVFSQHGGVVPAGFKLALSGSGVIFYTVNGGDPLVPDPTTAFTGTLRPGSKTYLGEFTLPGSATVRARSRNGSTWSALTEAYFSMNSVPAAAGNLVISKIQYQPAPATPAEAAAGHSRADFEFIELLNIGTQTVTLDGLSFSEGITIGLLAGGVRELAPGGRALLVAKKAAFEMRYGSGLPIAGEFTFGTNLNNTGETLTLRAANDAPIESFAYGASAPWPAAANGGGPALVLMHPATSDPAQAENWRQSTGLSGAPGMDDRLLFAAWQALHFLGGGPGTEALDDFDHDGLGNLIEFGLGTDPREFTPAGARQAAAVQTLDTGDGPARYATYTIRRVKAAEELTWTAATSTDLLAWSSAPADIVPLGPAVDQGDGTETVTFRATQPVTGDTPRFFRTVVTK